MRTYTQEEKQAVIDRVISVEPSQATVPRTVAYEVFKSFLYPQKRKHPTTKVVGCFLAGAQGLEP